MVCRYHAQMLKLKSVLIRLRLWTPNGLNVSKTLGLLSQSNNLFTVCESRLRHLPLNLFLFLFLFFAVLYDILLVILAKMLLIFE